MDAVKGLGPRLLAEVLAIVLIGCIGTSPEQQAADALGPDTGPYGSGPYHRAGFPCVTCHGGLWWQPGPTFELAGTVYRRINGNEPGRDAVVEIKDASGHAFSARANGVGNFFVMRAGTHATQFQDGQFQVPWPLDFPLSVRVRAVGGDQQMRNRVWRERSCAACHGGNPGAVSNGKIFVEEPTP
jgi:hypothetical protein